MIPNLLISAVFEAFKFVFSFIPSLPSLPPVVTDAADFFIAQLTAAQQLMVYFISPPLWYAGIAILIAITLFDYAVLIIVRILFMKLIMGVIAK